MKDTTAAVFNSPGQPLEFRRFPVPELTPGEALVQITACTLCGSDLHSYQGHRLIPTLTVFGHKIIRKIVALGPGEPICDFHGVHNYAPQDLAEALQSLKNNHIKFPFIDLVTEKFSLD